MKYRVMHMYVGAELSWIGGVEAQHRCNTDEDCNNHKICVPPPDNSIVCKYSICICVPTYAPIKPDPLTLSSTS